MHVVVLSIQFGLGWPVNPRLLGGQQAKCHRDIYSILTDSVDYRRVFLPRGLKQSNHAAQIGTSALPIVIRLVFGSGDVIHPEFQR
jgi:hypothetical protein